MKRYLLVILFLVISYLTYGQSCTLSVNITFSNPAICSGNTVTLTANAAAGIPPYTYVWSTGETTKFIDVNKAGTYSVTVSDNTAGCKPVVQQISISNSNTPPPPTAADGVSCPNGVAVLTATAPGGLYQWYDAPIGGNLLYTGPSFTTPGLTAPVTYYVDATVAGCTSTRKAVNVTLISSLYIADVNTCQGTSATLTATGATNYSWYDAPTGGNLIGTGPTYTTPILMASTTYYVVGSGNGCISNRSAANVIVTPTPQAPVVPNVTICSGSNATLSATAVPGQFYQWYDVPNGGKPLITSPDYTTPPLSASTTYYVEASSNGCVSPRIPVSVTVNAIPPAPVVSGASICSGNSTSLTVTNPSGISQWYSSPFSQTIIATGDTYQTPQLSATTTYYVLSNNAGCLSPRTAVVVNVTPFILPPSASGQTVCSGNAAVLTATALNGSIEWYDAATGGNLLSNNSVFTTPALSTNVTYYVQAVLANCSSTRVPVNLIVIPVPQAPTAQGQTVCSGTSAALVAAGSTNNYEWYDAPTGGKLLATSQGYITPNLSVNTVYYVQNTSNGCASPRTPVSVTVTPSPVLPVSSDATICQGNNATLTASAPAGSLDWYDAATGGKLLGSGNSFTTLALQVTTIYYVQNTVGQCSSARTPVTVNVTPVPNPQFQYSTGTFCASLGANPIPVINNPAGGTFTAAPAGLVFVSNTTGQINLAASTLGTYIITFTSNSCATVSTATVLLVATTDAHFSYSGPYCKSGINPLPALPPGAGTGTFSAAPAGLVFTNNTTGEIDLSKSLPGTYTVTNTISASGLCSSNTYTASVTIDPAATASAGPDQTVALGSKVQLAGSFSGATTVTWSGGTGSFSNSSSPTAIYTPGPGETSATLTLTTNDPPGPCGPQTSQVTITFQPAPTAPAVAATTTCPGSEATLTATGPGGVYQWYDAPKGGNLLAISAVFVTPPLLTTTTYYVQTVINGVTSPRSAVAVTVNAVLPPTSADMAVCSGSVATLTAKGSPGSYAWWDAATGGDLLATTSAFNTPAIFTTTTYYVEATVNGCTSSRTKVTVTANPIPAVTSLNAVSVCSGSPVNYAITSNVATTSYNWSRASVPNISNPTVSNQTAALIAETLINTSNSPVDVVYTITPSASGCAGTPFNLVVTVFPSVLVTSAKTQTICNNTSADYTVQFNTAPASFTWSRAAVPGISNTPVVAQEAAVIREVLTNITNKPVAVTYAYTINALSCPPTTFNLVVTVNPTDTLISKTFDEVCSGQPFNYNILSQVAGATYTWSRPTLTTISNPGVTNQAGNAISETLNNTTSSQVTVDYEIVPSFNGCPGHPFQYKVAVDPQPPAPVVNSNSPVCLNSSIRLNTVVVPGATYLWTGPNGFTSSLPNPVINNVTKANSGTYSLAFTTTGCPNAIAHVDVAVDDFPKADAGPNLTACLNSSSVKLNGKITGGTSTGVWSTAGTGTFEPQSNQLDGQYIPSAQDISAGSVVLTLTSTSKDDCTISSSTTTIKFQPGPTADAGGNLEVCVQDAAEKLAAQAKFADSYLWTTTGSGTFSPSTNVLAPFYVPSAADKKSGQVRLSLKATSNLCGEATSQAVIKFIPPPTVSAGADRYLVKGKTAVLAPSVSDDNVTYLWTPNISINDNTAKNPVITGLEDITYTLKVTDKRGCVSESKVSIKELDPIVTANTFTPNGDGINDTWNIPALIKYPSATVDIFNRYGQKMFHSDGYGIPWDGTNNGQPLPVGVYYFIINTKFEDEKLSGYVTIIR